MDLNVSMLMLLPVTFAPAGSLVCNGQIVNIADWPALFDVIGTQFGGNGTTTFGIPNIPPKPSGQTGSGPAITWVIVGEGPSYSSGSEALLGEVRPFVVAPPANSVQAETWQECNGALLNIRSFVALYALIGTKFGGDGITTFAVPNLAPITAVNRQIQFWIAKNGIFPSLACNPTLPQFDSDQSYNCYLTTIFQIPYTTDNAQRLCSFATCAGQMLAINNPWVAVFSLLGNRFGGNGSTNFNLPVIPTGADGINYMMLTNGIYPSRS